MVQDSLGCQEEKVCGLQAQLLQASEEVRQLEPCCHNGLRDSCIQLAFVQGPILQSMYLPCPLPPYLRSPASPLLWPHERTSSLTQTQNSKRSLSSPTVRGAEPPSYKWQMRDLRMSSVCCSRSWRLLLLSCHNPGPKRCKQRSTMLISSSWTTVP